MISFIKNFLNNKFGLIKYEYCNYKSKLKFILLENIHVFQNNRKNK